jgi:hypothetical protein
VNSGEAMANAHADGARIPLAALAGDGNPFVEHAQHLDRNQRARPRHDGSRSRRTASSVATR